MRELKFRTLRADEIEVRPVTIKDNKATMLLYISSRAVVRLLNDAVGPSEWEMIFDEVNGQVVGKMGVWDEDKGRFVYKSDTGSESNIEAAKGLFSDCYKRCLSRWGVDELYTAPRIIVEDDGYGCSGYKVSYIDYNENREIVRLKIVNRFGKVVFDWTEDIKTPYKPQNEVVGLNIDHNATAERINALTAFCAEKKGTVANNILKCFYDYYKAKADTWEGNMNFPRLWDGWLNRQNGSSS